MPLPAEALRVEDVSVVFRNNPGWRLLFARKRSAETHALSHVTLSAGSGEVLTILGPNGSGKTTLLKLIATTLLPTAGTILVQGEDLALHPERVRSRVAFAVASERSFFPRLTARENLAFFATLEDAPRTERTTRIEEVLVYSNLQDDADKLVMKFSSGMYQKLALARALVKRPAILLADEPSRSLDPGAAKHLWAMLRHVASRGTSVVLTTHNFEEAVAVAHSLAILKDGKLLSHNRLQEASVEELRRFYFQQVEPVTAEAMR